MVGMAEPARQPADPLIRWIAGSIVFVPAVAFWFGFDERFRTPKMLAGVGLALLGALAVSLAPHRFRLKPPRWADFAFDLVVVTAILSLLAGTTHRLTGWEDVLRLAGLSAAFSIFRRMDRPRDLLPLIALAAAANGGLALLQAAGLGFWETGRSGRHAVYGTFGNPNLLAEWLAVALPVIIAGTRDG